MYEPIKNNNIVLVAYQRHAEMKARFLVLFILLSITV